MDVEVEVKGTSENTRLHFELGLWREEASAPYVRHRKLDGYCRVQDERILIGCKKRDTHPTFRFLCPEVVLGENGEHGDLLSSALQRGGNRSQATFVERDRSNISYPKWAKSGKPRRGLTG